jgi:hypothetical protein
VWIDQLDIEPGMPWDREVEDALASCACLLVILSPVSVKSDNVRDEVSFALSKQKRIIPVLYRECEVPFRLRFGSFSLAAEKGQALYCKIIEHCIPDMLKQRTSIKAGYVGWAYCK